MCIVQCIVQPLLHYITAKEPAVWAREQEEYDRKFGQKNEESLPRIKEDRKWKKWVTTQQDGGWEYNDWAHTMDMDTHVVNKRRHENHHCVRPHQCGSKNCRQMEPESGRWQLFGLSSSSLEEKIPPPLPPPLSDEKWLGNGIEITFLSLYSNVKGEGGDTVLHWGITMKA